MACFGSGLRAAIARFNLPADAFTATVVHVGDPDERDLSRHPAGTSVIHRPSIDNPQLSWCDRPLRHLRRVTVPPTADVSACGLCALFDGPWPDDDVAALLDWVTLFVTYAEQLDTVPVDSSSWTAETLDVIRRNYADDVTADMATWRIRHAGTPIADAFARIEAEQQFLRDELDKRVSDHLTSSRPGDVIMYAHLRQTMEMFDPDIVPLPFGVRFCDPRSSTVQHWIDARVAAGAAQPGVDVDDVIARVMDDDDIFDAAAEHDDRFVDVVAAVVSACETHVADQPPADIDEEVTVVLFRDHGPLSRMVRTCWPPLGGNRTATALYRVPAIVADELVREDRTVVLFDEPITSADADLLAGLADPVPGRPLHDPAVLLHTLSSLTV